MSLWWLSSFISILISTVLSRCYCKDILIDNQKQFLSKSDVINMNLYDIIPHKNNDVDVFITMWIKLDSIKAREVPIKLMSIKTNKCKYFLFLLLETLIIVIIIAEGVDL